MDTKNDTMRLYHFWYPTQAQAPFIDLRNSSCLYISILSNQILHLLRENLLVLEKFQSSYESALATQSST